MLFSKKRFRAFLFAAGFVKEDVLLRKRRARVRLGSCEFFCLFYINNGNKQDIISFSGKI